MAAVRDDVFVIYCIFNELLGCLATLPLPWCLNMRPLLPLRPLRSEAGESPSLALCMLAIELEAVPRLWVYRVRREAWVF